MSEWYYSSTGYALFALSVYHVETRASAACKLVAILSLLCIASIHLVQGITKQMVSWWILTVAYLLYGAAYGAFMYATYA